jgi:hypothetical protein
LILLNRPILNWNYYKTFERIQERPQEKVKVPARKDIHEDFPLRGFILCDDCGRPLTSCWSQGKTKKFAYYQCYFKDCESRQKSIPRHLLEGAFETLLAQIKPSPALCALAAAMFKDAWNQQAKLTSAGILGAKQKLVSIEKQIEQLVDRIIETSVPSAITRYEQRIAEFEKEKLLMEQTMQKQTLPQGRFEEMFELSMLFLANPLKLWHSGKLEHKRTVLNWPSKTVSHTAENQGFEHQKPPCPSGF